MVARLPLVAFLALVSGAADASPSGPVQMASPAIRAHASMVLPTPKRRAVTVPTPISSPGLASAWSTKIDARLASLASNVGGPVGRASLLGGATEDDTDAPPTARPALDAKLRAIAEAAPRGSRVGIAVKDLSTDATVFEWNAAEPLNPASNHKLLTATAAVALLGADFQFRTRVVRDGDTLYIIGGGDPSLQVDDLEQLADHAKAATEGGTPIRNIRVDESFFSARRFGPGYDPSGPGVSYMAPSAPLSMQFNTVMISAQPGRSGEAPRINVSPSSDHIVVRNTATTLRGGSLSIETHAEGDKTVVEVAGRMGPRHGRIRIRRRVTDPGAFAAQTFADRFCADGGCDEVVVSKGSAPERAKTLAVHTSAPLPEVLQSALRFSNNFTTEQVLRTLGHLSSGEPGDWSNGSDILLRFWDAAGQARDDLTFENASGLSRRGRVTPMALVDLLSLWTDPSGAPEVLDALPIAGRQGTLARRLRRSGGRVKAKTGTMKGASALTGVVTDRDGTPRLGFSILVNGSVGGPQARRIQDRVVMALL